MIPIRHSCPHHTAYPSSFKTTTLTVIRPYPWLWSVSPSSLQVGNYSVSFNGNNFASDSKAQANGVDLPTTYVSKTKLVATGNAVAVGTILFTVRQPGSGAVTGNSVSAPVTAVALTVAVAPATATVQLGSSQTFTATVAGNANTAVTWSVVGGPANGTISSGGVFTAPAVLPAVAVVTVQATSVANALISANATVTLLPAPVIVAVTPTSAIVQLGNTKTFVATVTGNANTAVTWSVLGGSANGTISSSGIYAPPAVMPVSPTVTVRGTAVSDPNSSADAMITLTPAVDYAGLLAASRFLEQSSFGPTPATLAAVQQLGIDGYLQQQFSLPASVIPTPPDNSVGTLQQWTLHNYTAAPDQLRQRVIYALSQIVVISANKQIYADAMLPWMNILSQQAFGNYKDLLRDVARSSSMGKFLDLANSSKPGISGGANENFPREAMQLFTSTFPAAISTNGPALFCTGNIVQSASLLPGFDLDISGMSLWPASAAIARKVGLQQVLEFDSGLALVQAANTVRKDALDLNALLRGGTATITTPFPGGSLSDQLQQVAKIIKLRSVTGIRRQVFFCTLGGFDTHSSQSWQHWDLLKDVAEAMAAFYKTTDEELGVADGVTSFTLSDFGRTLQPSGSGCDHGWGSHLLLMGGALQGGQVYGTFPSLALGGDDDSGTRGALIPTTSTEQFGAVLATWMGVPDTGLTSVFSNLSDFGSGWNDKLGFLG